MIAVVAGGVCNEGRERKKPPVFLVVYTHASLTDDANIAKVNISDPVPCLSSPYGILLEHKCLKI